MKAITCLESRLFLMIRFLIIFIVFSVFESCIKEKSSASHIVITNNKEDSILNTKHLLTDTNSFFLSLIYFLDTSGYRFDTSRLFKFSHYKEFEKRKLDYENEYPIYSINILNHAIIREIRNDPEESQAIDSTIFQRVIAIRGYAFYGSPEPDGRADGVVEEWEFSNEREAINAINEFKKFRGHAYFNTMSYGMQHDNYFYLLHSRSMGSCYVLKKLFVQYPIPENNSF
jgi:hypothetical protein